MTLHVFDELPLIESLRSRHVLARQSGYFGGHTNDFGPGSGPLCIEHRARRVIVGRGVSLDVEHAPRACGETFNGFAGESIGAGEFAAAADLVAIE